MGTKLPVAWSLPCFTSWAIPALSLQCRCTWLAKLQTVSATVSGYAGWRRGGSESKTWLTLPLVAVICLLDVWFTSQMPNRLTSLLQTYGTTRQWTPNGNISCLLLWWPHTTHLLIRQVPLGRSGEPKCSLNSLKKSLQRKGAFKDISSPPPKAPNKNITSYYTWFLPWQKQKKFTSPLTLKIYPSSSSDFSFYRSISLSVPFPSLSHLSLLLAPTLEPDERPLKTQSSW